MGLIKSIKKRWDLFSHVNYCNLVGFYKYKSFDGEIYIRHPKHYVNKKQNTWVCENVYYKYYEPNNEDVVVDIGAGYGEEAVYLHSRAPNIKFYGIEIQPVIYECLSNTLNSLNENFTCTSSAISNSDAEIYLKSQLNYSEVCKKPTKGYVHVPCLSWNDYLKKQNINKIDLLKMNIEGAEKDLLSSIDSFDNIRRLIISCHDFRANNGEGEFFRTKEAVMKILCDNKFNIKVFESDIDWLKDWIYAEK